MATRGEALKGTHMLKDLLGHDLGGGSESERQTTGTPIQAPSQPELPSRSVAIPANDARASGAPVATGPGGPDLIELERHQRALTQPAIVAISILFACFSLLLVVGVTHAYAPTRLPFLREAPPTVQIVIGAAGIFACLVLFSIGYVVNRLK